MVQRSRQASANPRPVYCDAAVQTDPVEGEWFSTPPPVTRPKKRVISLAKRLLDSRRKVRDDDQRQQTQSPTPRPASSAAMEVDTTLASTAPAANLEVKSAASQPDDVAMTDADQPAQPVSKPSSVFVEDFSQEAAYSLQCLHMMGGNEQAAMAVTNEWLVI